MSGGTTFHFVTDGIQAALKQAVDAANRQDVRLGGGVATMRQYLRAGLVDKMHIAVSPVLIGSGERLFEGIGTPGLGYQVTDHIAGPGAMHMIIKRK
jgi:dihydrofolate reductase